MAWLVKPSTTRSMTSASRGVRRSKRPRSSSSDCSRDQLVENARQAPVDGGQQVRVVHRLLDEVLGAGLDGGDRHRHVGMARDQHHGQGNRRAATARAPARCRPCRACARRRRCSRGAGRRRLQEGIGRVRRSRPGSRTRATSRPAPRAPPAWSSMTKSEGRRPCSGGLLGLNRQREAELRRPGIARLQPDAPAVRLHDRGADRQAEARARPSWTRSAARTGPGSGETPPPLSVTPISIAGPSPERRALMRMRPSGAPRFGDGLHGIVHEVEDHLLELDAVAEDRRQRIGELKLDGDLLGSGVRVGEHQGVLQTSLTSSVLKCGWPRRRNSRMRRTTPPAWSIWATRAVRLPSARCMSACGARRISWTARASARAAVIG